VLRELAPKSVMVGVIDLGTNAVETPEQVAERIRAALKFIAPEKLVVAPDCGMKYLERHVAYGKLVALARAPLSCEGKSPANYARQAWPPAGAARSPLRAPRL